MINNKPEGADCLCCLEVLWKITMKFHAYKTLKNLKAKSAQVFFPHKVTRHPDSMVANLKYGN